MAGLSQLKLYSLATVAVNKKLTSKEIECTPDEVAPMIDGEITDDTKTYKASATDKDGAAYDLEVKTTLTVKATWLPMGGSNRMTAPDVRRGELVVLYQFADSDQFWWTTLKDDMKFRKLETVIYAFSATTDEAATMSSENMYFLEVSTHNKMVHFHTSKANGEPYIYDIQINTKVGFIQIQDDVGNLIRFDSKERQIELLNNDGSKVEINKTNIFLESKDLIAMKSAKITQDSTSHIVTADTLDITATTEHTGNITENGNVKINGNTEITGIMKSGSIVTGALSGGVGGGAGTFTGTLTANQVISVTNISAPNV